MPWNRILALRSNNLARRLYFLLFRPFRSAARNYDYLQWNFFLDWIWRFSPSRAKQVIVRHLLSSSPHYLYPKNELFFQPGEYESAFKTYNESRKKIGDKLLLPYISGESTVLELGCGPGGFLKALASHCRGIIGTDVSRAALRIAEWNTRDFSNVNLKAINGLNLDKIGNATIDFVYSIETIQHLDKFHVFSFFKEFRRVLKPKGTILFDFINILDPAQFNGWLETWKSQSVRIYADMTVMRIRYYHPGELRVLLGAAGFTDITFFDSKGAHNEDRATFVVAKS